MTAATLEQRAIATLAATAKRLGASRADLDRAVEALTGVPAETAPRALPRIAEGIPLSPSDKARIRALIHAGGETTAIAEEVGCSRQAVSGVRVGMRRHEDAQARA